MTGLTDLAEVLAALEVTRRPGSFTYITVEAGDRPGAAIPPHPVEAVIREDEGTTLVVSHDQAGAAGLPIEHDLAWLTLAVPTSLDAVGVTAVVARALADAGIPCNVLAAHHHDHFLVPTAGVDGAIDCLRALRTGPGSRDRGR